jgi:sugar/nucleoside kinase (ribokinase family)
MQQERKNRAQFDVCVIGPVTWDMIEAADGEPPQRMPGGVVTYAGLVYRRLGLKTAVITKAARADAADITRALRRSGVSTVCLPSERTAVFHNSYTGRLLGKRKQRVASLADPFRSDDLGHIDARVFHLGPLMESDMDADFVSAVRSRGGQVTLDVQGMLRCLVDGDVQSKNWDECVDLAGIDVIKANWDEAQRLAGCTEADSVARRIASLGPREVIVTRRDQGALIVVENILYRIVAMRPSPIRDPTGCGDTFLAGYTTRRLQCVDVAGAGRFAAALAAVCSQHYGPWSGSRQEVDAALAREQPG